MKILKIFIYLITLFIGFSNAIAADFNYFKTGTNRWKSQGERNFWNGKITPEILNRLDSIYELSPQSYTFYTVNEDAYVVIGCTFDLYKIEGTELVNQYNLFNRGYTCASTPLVKDNQHYLLSGYSFWANHLDLMVLDPIQSSWEFVKTQNQPEYYNSTNIYQNSKGIYTLFGGFYNPRKDLKTLEENGYFMDWETQTWRKIEIQIAGVDLKKAISMSEIRFFETKDYGFLQSNEDQKNLGWNLIDKEKGEIYFFNSRNSDMFFSPYLEISGNKIAYLTPNGTPRFINLEEIMAKSVKVGQIKFMDSSVFEVPTLKDFFYISVIFVLVTILLIGLFLLRKKDLPIQVFTAEPITQFIDLILPYSGKFLNTESLDKILGIDKLENFDSKRLKRSRIISEINKQYTESHQKELIIRGKNPEDKRFVYYEIEA